MWLKDDVKVFAAKSYATIMLGICEVAHHDDVLPFGRLEDTYRQSRLFFQTIVCNHTAAWSDEMREMLHGIIFRCIAQLTCFRVHLHQRVLLPSPWAFPMVCEDEIPDVVFVAALADIVREQEEGMLACLPIH